MTWDEVVACPELRNLPFKIETNRWGQIIMSPAYNPHGDLQMTIGLLLQSLLRRGKVHGECSVQTSDGVRAPDVAWSSPERYRQIRRQSVYQIAPDLCVEIRSPSNSDVEMTDKRRLYFERGAREVWVVHATDRGVAFYNPTGRLETSMLCPGFPAVLPEDEDLD